MITEYLFEKFGLLLDKFIEGFAFGTGLYIFYKLGLWMGWF